MGESINDIAERIKLNLMSLYTNKGEVLPISGNVRVTSCSSPLPTLKGKIKMWVNMCIEYDLETNTVQVIKGPWTKIAGDSFSKKKPVKPPKVAEDKGIKGVNEI